MTSGGHNEEPERNKWVFILFLNGKSNSEIQRKLFEEKYQWRSVQRVSDIINEYFKKHITPKLGKDRQTTLEELRKLGKKERKKEINKYL